MLINGEFGERLAKQATRFGLTPRVLAWRWGEPWDLDRIDAALDSEGPCYTFPSPTLIALEAALQEYATTERAQATFARYNELGVFVRAQLRKLDLEPLANEESASPVVTTFSPPGKESSV